MATTTIVLKHSSTPGSVPHLTDLVEGEVALNTTDKKLYYKTSGGAIQDMLDVPIATPTNAGLISTADKTKLDGIETGATKNSTDAQLRDRSTQTGTQSISTIDTLSERLDQVMRIRILTPSTMIELLTQLWYFGPGYYRVDTILPATPQYGAGLYSRVGDTYTFAVCDYTNGMLTTISGNGAGIAAGSYSVQQLGTAATQNVQTDMYDVDRTRVTKVGSFGWGINQTQYNGDVGNVIGDATLNDMDIWTSGVRRFETTTIPGTYGALLRLGGGKANTNGGWFSDLAFPTSGRILERHNVNTDVWTDWDWLVKGEDLSANVGSAYGVMDSGSNANGQYMRFRNGLMICTSNTVTFDGSDTEPAGTIRTLSWTFPAAFYTDPQVTACARAFGNAADFIGNYASQPITETEIPQAAVRLNLSGIGPFPMKLQAIGQWKAL